MNMKVIGPSRPPAMTDRGKLTYTEATLLEVQRIAVIGKRESNLLSVVDNPYDRDFIWVIYQPNSFKIKFPCCNVVEWHVLPNKNEIPIGHVLYTSQTLFHISAPLALPHTASRDVTVAGYTVPKDAFVIPNIYSCHRDHDLWGDPDNFRPERWIGEDGKLQSFPAFITFGVGKW